MSEYDERLESFFSENMRRKKLLPSVMRVMACVLSAGKGGRIPLQEEGTLNAEKVALVITEATGVRVKDIEFVSLSGFSREKAAEFHLLMSQQIHMTLTQALRKKWGSVVWKGLTEAGKHVAFSVTVLETACLPLATALDTTIAESTDLDERIRQTLAAYIYPQLSGAVLTYLGLACTSGWWKRKRLDRFWGLMESLQAFVPLGERADKRGVWLVLVA